MSFRFNFSGADERKPDLDTKEEIQWLESVEVVPKNQIKDLDIIVNRAQMVTSGDVEIGHVVVSEALSNIEDTGSKTAVNLAENEHSDLVTGKYEGGLKIWECTHDLLHYFVQNEEIDFENKQVLDLGCGAGILGIYAFMKSAHVTFQDYTYQSIKIVIQRWRSEGMTLVAWELGSPIVKDITSVDTLAPFHLPRTSVRAYGLLELPVDCLQQSAVSPFVSINEEVLDYVTIPNVLLNIEEEERESGIKKCKFYSGDWASFNKKIDTVFDVIVTSETIYNECNYDKLISLFKDRLSNNGVVYVAAKTHYFGVGGGTRQFEKAVEKKGLLSEVCWKSLGGFQREILKITK